MEFAYDALSNRIQQTVDTDGTARQMTPSGTKEKETAMYDPTLGRWLTEDPLGFDAGDANLYRYVANGPTNGVDPWGLDTMLLEKAKTDAAKPGNGGYIRDPRIIDQVQGEIDRLKDKERRSKTNVIGLQGAATRRWRRIFDAIVDVGDPTVGLLQKPGIIADATKAGKDLGKIIPGIAAEDKSAKDAAKERKGLEDLLPPDNKPK